MPAVFSASRHSHRPHWMVVFFSAAFFFAGLSPTFSQVLAGPPEPLWPGNPPGFEASPENQPPIEGDLPEYLITRVDSDQPTAAVVILPGGGYYGLATSHEGHDVAKWFESMGITSATCKYRVRGQSSSLTHFGKTQKGNHGKGYGHPYPMMDAQRAIQTLRARSQELNIDPNRIGVIGFSAGGHLASTISTKFLAGDPDSEDPIARVSSRPDFSVLCYPVIGMGKPYTHQGSQRSLLGKDADPNLVAGLSSEDQVTAQTPPTFLFHTSTDKVVDAENSIQYYLACQRAGVPVELHVFPDGHHGLGLAKKTSGVNQWPILCESWLRKLGMTTP